MDSKVAFTQILILFSILLAGIVLKKTKQLNETAEDTMSALIVKLGLPCMVLASTNIERTTSAVKDVYTIFFMSIIFYVIMFAVGALGARMLHLKKHSANVFVALITFANVGFMGFPLVRSFYGEIGVFYTAIVNLIFNLTLWTIGILLFNRSEKLHIRKLINAGTVSCVAAILLFLFGIRFPTPIYSALNTAGNMTVPLSMLMIGSLIADRNIVKAFADKNLLVMSFMRLLLIPIATGLLLNSMGVNQTVTSIFTILAAMPAGALNAVFAREYNSDQIMASEGIFVSTLFSIGTLPFIVIFVNHILG